MVDRVGTRNLGIILTALAVIYIVGLKCAPPMVEVVGDFDTIVQEYIENETIGVANSDRKKHMESLGEIK